MTAIVVLVLVCCVFSGATWVRAQARHLDSEPEVAAFLAARAITSGWSRDSR